MISINLILSSNFIQKSPSPFINAPPKASGPENNSRRQLLAVSQCANLYNLTGNNISIAFVDTGINLSHDVYQRFNGIIPYFDVNRPELGTQYGNPGDVHGHGTHIASIALGNSTQFQGMAPSANCIFVKLFNSSTQSSTTSERLLLGLNWILNYSVKHPIHIVSLSVGMSMLDNPDIFFNITKEFMNRGIMMVASAGNEGEFGDGTIYSPGVSPYVITVGAINGSSLKLYEKSGKGPTIYGGHKPDIVAPGVEELGADCVNNGYKYLTGTSVSVPYVSGILALFLEYLQNNPFPLTIMQIKGFFALGTRSVMDSSPVKHDNNKGWGLIQLSNAIDFLDVLRSLSGQNSPNLGVTDSLQFFHNTGGIKGYTSDVILRSVWILANQSYQLALNNTKYEMGLFLENFSLNGEPQLLFASKDQIMRISVNQTGRYYLVVKGYASLEPSESELVISILDNNSFPQLFLVDLIAFLALCGIISGLLYSNWHEKKIR